MPFVDLKRLFFLFVAAAAVMPALAFSSNDSEVTDWNNRGVEEARAGKFEEAVGSLRHALALNPNDPAAKKNLSGILFHRIWKEKHPGARHSATLPARRIFPEKNFLKILT